MLFVIYGQTFESLELRYIFQKLAQNKKKTNVGHSESDEIINANA